MAGRSKAYLKNLRKKYHLGEFAKVRRLYTQLGVPERTTIEYFDGPHTIHGVGTFDFLHKYLNWPKR